MTSIRLAATVIALALSTDALAFTSFTTAWTQLDFTTRSGYRVKTKIGPDKCLLDLIVRYEGRRISIPRVGIKDICGATLQDTQLVEDAGGNAALTFRAPYFPSGKSQAQGSLVWELSITQGKFGGLRSWQEQ